MGIKKNRWIHDHYKEGKCKKRRAIVMFVVGSVAYLILKAL